MLFAQWNAGMPEAASTIATQVDDLYVFMFWVSVVSLAGVLGAILYFGIRYRRTEENQEAVSKVDDNVPLEVIWTAVPTVVLVVIFGWGVLSWMDMRVAPSEAMDIHVTARQWSWQFEYPDEGILSENLVVPAGKPVRLIMTSVDVLHSFFVPEFRVKQDIVPGRYTSLWFEAPNPGTYNIMCAEYCGKDHSRMNRLVQVMTQEDYMAWIDSGGGLADLSLVDRGELLFKRSGCTQCHSADGTAGTGPSLKGVYGSNEDFTDGTSALVDENYIRESILYPNRKIVKGYTPAMPTYANSLRDAQLNAIVAYVKSLGSSKEGADE